MKSINFLEKFNSLIDNPILSKNTQYELQEFAKLFEARETVNLSSFLEFNVEIIGMMSNHYQKLWDLFPDHKFIYKDGNVINCPVCNNEIKFEKQPNPCDNFDKNFQKNVYETIKDSCCIS